MSASYCSVLETKVKLRCLCQEPIDLQCHGLIGRRDLVRYCLCSAEVLVIFEKVAVGAVAKVSR